MYIFKYYFMHKNLLILIFYISFFLSYRLYSKEQDTIAIVDMEKVFENTNCIKIAKEKLENEKKAIENSIREKERALQEEQEDIESKASILSQAKIQQKREEFQKKVMEFQQEINKKNTKLQTKFNNLLDKIKNEVTLVLKTDKYKIYSVILNNTLIIYNNSAIDITQEVIKDLNKKKISLE